ncbi:MAG: AraC family transcriptional regulator, partial [Acetatifactor sp.]|nr:AraC family transcriptional regulator [Acetatifactor sp.]
SYIEDHLGQELSLEEIARELHYSKYYVARAFKENTGMTLHRYIRDRRLSEAARKLAQTRQPILEVAFDAGYGSQQAFTQAFHREYLCTPQEYRRIGRFVPRQDRLTDRFPSSYLGSATGKSVVFLRNMMEPCVSRKCVSQVCFSLERGIAA